MKENIKPKKIKVKTKMVEEVVGKEKMDLNLQKRKAIYMIE